MNWKSTQWNHGVTVKNKPQGFVAVLSPSANLNSVQSDVRVELGQIVTLVYRINTIAGTPRFAALDRGGPANFSVMIAHGELDGRWYVNGVNYVPLQPALDKGELRYEVKLAPKLWQDVNGKQNASAFKEGVKDARIMQVVFGGKFRAHGVEVTGGKVRIAIEVHVQ